ncbi:hypothetical protein [Streptococcus danieliae]|uniref:Uncharacterized protein n=1 Tax=Streptococcus danieliae TaxID=747656 RepID=A0A7Z0M6G7_9STRE|nr:hypothetical protein [Streptococcus danieliae]MBF0699154.1 hypothetical protein [Streptococcus danieliae]MVX58144.1 hypothetical protein [Streptococcus danieliae]NYS96330.1 hypothetical protein [Streptococcus danieliae]
MNELYLSIHDQLLTLLVLFLLLGLTVFHRKPKIETTEETRATKQETELTPDYGRYIWLAGRYYN